MQGINEDDTSAESNGAGKSTVADAICWCLFGETARGLVGDAIVRRDSKGGAMVALTLADAGGDTYQIIRYRKHKLGKNALHVKHAPAGGSEIDLTKGTDKLTQDVVCQILGCSYDVFKAAVYAGQEQMPDLPSLTDKHLKILVEEAAGTNVLERAYKIASLRTNEAEKSVLRLSTDEDALKRQVAFFLDQAESAKKGQVAHEASCKFEIDTIEGQLKALDTAHKEACEALDTLDEPGIRKKIADCDDRIAAVDGEHRELRRLELVANDAARRLATFNGQLSSAKTYVTDLKHQADHVEDRVGSPCKSCGKTYAKEDLADAKKAATAQLVEAAGKLKTLVASRASAESAHKSALDAVETFRATMTDLTSVNAERAQQQKGLVLVAEVQSKIDQIERAVIGLEGKVEELKKPSPHAKLIAEAESKAASAQAGLDSTVEDLKRARGRLDQAEAARRIFSPAGVRAHILDTVTPFLNDRTAKYLGILTDGSITATWSTLTKTAKGELREKFAIEVQQIDGGASFAAISGGEKRKVRIACFMALQDMVASRASKPLELFVADEIDDALDSAGLERLMMILDEKAKSCGSLFIISHQDLKSWIGNVLIVRRKAGVTTVEEAA